MYTEFWRNLLEKYVWRRRWEDNIKVNLTEIGSTTREFICCSEWLFLTFNGFFIFIYIHTQSLIKNTPLKQFSSLHFLYFQVQISQDCLLTLSIGSDSRMPIIKGVSRFSAERSPGTSATFNFSAPPEFSSAICSTTVKACVRALPESSNELDCKTKSVTNVEAVWNSWGYIWRI